MSYPVQNYVFIKLTFSVVISFMEYKVGEIGQRPWGYWKVEEVGLGFIKKTIVINSGASLSLQSHEYRSEKWEIVSGIAEVTVGYNVFSLKEGEKTEVPIRVIHRLRNIGDTPLTIKELQLGEILDEDDIIRYEDSYGRCKTEVGQRIIFLADMDGTLTPARLPMTKEFASFFEKFIADRVFYIVSGSDYKKIQEQVPMRILTKVTGVYASMGNEFYERGNLIYKNDFVPKRSLLEKLEAFRKNTKYSLKLYQNYIEKRCGMINFSVLGRDCPYEARIEYSNWDKKSGERAKIAEELSADYPEYDISVGGNISIDIVPYGFGKDQVATRLRNVYKAEKVVFMGDRTEKGGNDYSIAQKLLILGNAEIIAVNGPDDVIRILKEKYE
ncbi:MAG: HAD-IIB family hydrolase [Holosporaceae bacterium]|jgi:HAD superfamily hydrolase (TIGR01484 family)|nr:HAD-IIB family hydrolase [Holosporaceae bacterium]